MIKIRFWDNDASVWTQYPGVEISEDGMIYKEGGSRSKPLGKIEWARGDVYKTEPGSSRMTLAAHIRRQGSWLVLRNTYGEEVLHINDQKIYTSESRREFLPREVGRIYEMPAGVSGGTSSGASSGSTTSEKSTSSSSGGVPGCFLMGELGAIIGIFISGPILAAFFFPFIALCIGFYENLLMALMCFLGNIAGFRPAVRHWKAGRKWKAVLSYVLIANAICILACLIFRPAIFYAR